MTQPAHSIELEAEIVSVYHGPLDEFISRRDALVKQLRAAKRREDADRVKSLRKPSRMAWVLDAIVHEEPASIEQLAAAIVAAQTGTNLRAAFENVKAAVRDVAAAGARVAIRAGHPIEANAITGAVNAVMGDAGAFAELRAGRLVDVPEGGGLDMLTAIQVIAPATTPPSSEPPSREPDKVAPRDEPATQNAELARAARAELHRAESSLAEFRERREHAEQTVRDTQQELDAAERELLNAQAKVQARRAEVERARREAAATASATGDAERAVLAARSRVVDSTEGENSSS